MTVSEMYEHIRMATRRSTETPVVRRQDIHSAEEIVAAQPMTAPTSISFDIVFTADNTEESSPLDRTYPAGSSYNVIARHEEAIRTAQERNITFAPGYSFGQLPESMGVGITNHPIQNPCGETELTGTAEHTRIGYELNNPDDMYEIDFDED